MAYLLSATKLKSYARCPKAYYFRYECELNKQSVFGSAALGTALHNALAQFYQDWHYHVHYRLRHGCDSAGRTTALA